MAAVSIILALSFISVALFAFVAFQPLTSRTESRLRAMVGAGGPAVVLEDMAPKQNFQLPRAWQAYLARAGKEWTASQFMFVAFAHLVGGAALGASQGFALPGAAAGLILLFVRLRVAQGRRQLKMTSQLPLALMLIATSLRSGLGFQQALQLVGREGPQPLSGEFSRFADELAMGLSIEEALARLQLRLNSIEGEMLAAAILVQRQTGGNLSEILLNLHDTIRDRQAVMGQIRTLTAMGRLSGWILTAIPVLLALAFYFLNRDYVMTLVTDPRGQYMAGAATCLMIAGGLMIRRIVQITL